MSLYVFFYAASSFRGVDLPASIGRWEFLFYGGPFSIEGLLFFCLGLQVDLVKAVETVQGKMYCGFAIAAMLFLFALRIYLPGQYCFLLRPFIAINVLVLLLSIVPDSVFPHFVVRSSFALFASHYFVLKIYKLIGLEEVLLATVSCIVVGAFFTWTLQKMPFAFRVILTGGR